MYYCHYRSRQQLVIVCLLAGLIDKLLQYTDISAPTLIHSMLCSCGSDLKNLLQPRQQACNVGSNIHKIMWISAHKKEYDFSFHLCLQWNWEQNNFMVCHCPILTKCHRKPAQPSLSKKNSFLKQAKNGDQRQMQTLRDNKIRTKTQLRFTKGITTQQQNFTTTNLHELMMQYVLFQHGEATSR